MKWILIFSLLIFGFSPSYSAFAQSGERPANPGEDPVEQKTRGGSEVEATVAKTGICNECVQNMYHGSLTKKTNPVRGSSNAVTDDKPSSTRGEQ